MKPPMAPQKPHVAVVHGQTRSDDYFWLREREAPEVIAYLEAENAYTAEVMRHTERLQNTLYEEMKGRIKETDLSVPTKVDDYYYYTRTFEGKQYPAHYRKRGSLDAPEELLLDLNQLAEGQKYFRLGAFQVSPDHNLLAYSTDTDGSEVYTLRVKDLRTGQLLPDAIPGVYYGVEWANDNGHLYYTVLNEAKRPFKAFRHTLGTPPDRDVLIHHEADDRFNVRLGKTRSRRFILLSLGSQITSEVRLLDADTPASEFRIVHPRQQGMEYRVEHHGDDLYIVTNDNAVNFKLVKAPVAAPGKSNWTEVIAHRPKIRLEGVDAFRNHLVIYERAEGLRQMRVRDFHGGEYYVPFPEPVYTFRAGPNEEFDTQVVRLNYTSLVTPRTVYDYDVISRTFDLKKQEEVLGGYDPIRYQSERIAATAPDGTQVPMSIVYRKGMKRNGRNPTLLYGYGSYGASMDPNFSSARLSLIDRGMIYAIAHIRGGGDLGRPWYEDGKLLRKMNTFTDFIACAEHLVNEKYTSPDRLAIQGGSAGGLLMGTVTNMRPELFKAVVAQVPFVDVINTMLDASIPLTVVEYEEWGNPNDKTYHDYMIRYSPYDNIESKAYPNILITAGLNDPRVQYWEPAKWTAKLRAKKTDSNRLLLKTEMGAGHGGPSGRYDHLKETAFVYAFLLDTLGLGS